ncbi:MAG: hypothetical protein LBD11_08560 [Candidatus Peribacteria bacterium]|nr:hypothetical protein [Candidatus Peribacteria bacterium]
MEGNRFLQDFEAKMEKKEKKTSVSTKRILQYIRAEYKVFKRNGILAIACRVITTICHLLPALFYKDIINLLSSSLASSEIASNAIAILMYIFWIKLTSAILHRCMDYFLVTFEMDIMEDVYNKLFAYLQKHSFQFFTDNFTGSLISKIRKGANSFERFSDTINRNVIPFILYIVIILFIIGAQYLWLAVGLFGVIVVCSIVQYKLFLRAFPYQDKANALDSEL